MKRGVRIAFNKDTAIECANLVSNVYLQYEKGITSQPDYLYKGYKILSNIYGSHNNVMGVALMSDKGIFIALRGTDNFYDVLHDLRFAWAAYTEGKDILGRVEAGFKKEFDSLYTNIPGRYDENHILDLVIGYRGRIIVTGHSLGGALAAYTAWGLKTFDYNFNISVYTFGCPSVGDTNFRRLYDTFVLDSHNVQNHLDIVPSLPPGIAGYYGVGKKLILQSSDDSFRTSHSIDTYIKNLNKLV